MRIETTAGSMLGLLLLLCVGTLPLQILAWNSTYGNPILPGFHPDPSCVFVQELDNTFFCASSSFSVFPGIPIHASKDLVNWKLISNALSRPEQLPTLAVTNKSTSGIWASTIRYQEGTFYLLTTLVFDDQPESNFSRWDNMIFTSSDPYTSASWSQPVHFNFTGYDTSPFWDADGTVYVTGSHPWEVTPGITQTTLNLTTGEVGDSLHYVWNGTGGQAPEGPHIYWRDGYYYLMIAEGGTGLNHMETIARSLAVGGPYEANPANPILTNANTTEYFQTVGHADLFQDAEGNWWGVALSTRSGPEFTVYPMGRETVLYPVTWEQGEWPVLQPVRGEMDGWHLPAMNLDIPGEGYAVPQSSCRNVCSRLQARLLTNQTISSSRPVPPSPYTLCIGDYQSIHHTQFHPSDIQTRFVFSRLNSTSLLMMATTLDLQGKPSLRDGRWTPCSLTESTLTFHRLSRKKRLE